MQTLRESETRSKPVQCFNNSQNRQIEAQETNNDITANCNGDDNSANPTIATSQIEELPVRDE